MLISWQTILMKKLFLMAGILLLIAPIFAFGATTKAGLTPKHIFYFLDQASEGVSLFFTFNPENKAKKALKYADERLAEIEAVAEEKNPDVIKAVIVNYENNIALATEKSKEVKDKGRAETLLTSIADNTSRNQEILAAVLIKVPEEAKEAITQAIEASRKGQEEATKQIAELKGEVEKLKQEIAELKAKSEAGTAKAEAEARAATERKRLQAEKAKTEAGTLKAEAERQRLQSEVDAYRAKEAINTQKQAEINKGIYCNGKYWSQCPAGQTFTCPSSGNAYCSIPKTSTTIDNESEALKNAIQAEIEKRKTASEQKTAQMDAIYAKYKPSLDEINSKIKELAQKILIPNQSTSELRQQAIDSLELNTKQTQISSQLNGELCSQLGYCDYNQQSPSYKPPLFSNYDNFSVYVNGGQRVLNVIGTGNGFNVTDSLTGGGYSVQNIGGSYFIQSY